MRIGKKDDHQLDQADQADQADQEESRCDRGSRRAKWGMMLIALLLGALVPLGFAPFSLSLIVPLSLMALLQLTVTQSPRFSALLGVLYGFGLFSWGIFWVRISLVQFGGAPLVVGALIALLLALYLSLYYGVLLYLTRRLGGYLSSQSRSFIPQTPQSIKHSRIVLAISYGLLFPLLGVLLEYLRSHLFSGFPWLALGYSFTDLRVATWLFPQMGALMASFWVYWIAGLLFVLLQALLGMRQQKGQETIEASDTLSVTSRQQKRGGFLTYLLPSLIGGAAVALIMFMTAMSASTTIERGKAKIKIGLVQGNIPQEMKFSQAQYQAIIRRYYQLTEKIAPKVDLVIWPETAIPGIYEEDFSLSTVLRDLSIESGSTIVTGIFSTEGPQIRNSIVAYGTKASEDQLYHKVHLVPFGEYIPFRSLLSLFGNMIEIPFADLSEGTMAQKPLSFMTTQGRFQGGSSICYEAVFGNEARLMGRESDFLINVSNDAWFGDSIGPWQHFQITRARAIELQKEMVRSTNNGITAWIGANGQVKAMLPQFQEGVLEVAVTPIRGVTAYGRLGDLFWGVSFLLLLSLTMLIGRFYCRKFIARN